MLPVFGLQRPTTGTTNSGGRWRSTWIWPPTTSISKAAMNIRQPFTTLPTATSSWGTSLKPNPGSKGTSISQEERFFITMRPLPGLVTASSCNESTKMQSMLFLPYLHPTGCSSNTPGTRLPLSQVCWARKRKKVLCSKNWSHKVLSQAPFTPKYFTNLEGLLSRQEKMTKL